MLNEAEAGEEVEEDDLPGVPPGWRGQYSHGATCLEDYSAAIVTALHQRSIEEFRERPHEVQRVDARSLSQERFLEEFARRGLPVVLTHAMERWDHDVWNSPEGVAHAYGDDTPWTARRGPSYAEMESVETTLPAYLSNVRDVSSDAGNSEHTPQDAAPRAQWYGANNWLPPWMAPHLELPKFYPAHVFRATDTRLWVGPAGSGVHLHCDIQDNFSMQCFGHKRWTLVAPHHAAELGVTSVTPFLHNASVPPPPDHILTLTVGPREMLFVPACWFHATEALHEEGGQLSGTVNFFASACFGALGVIMPDFPTLCQERWMAGLEPKCHAAS